MREKVMMGGYDSTREGDKRGSKWFHIPNNPRHCNINVYFFEKILELEEKRKLYGWLYPVIVFMNGLCLLKD